MDYKTILENWQKFAQSTKPLTLTERRDIMNEVSKNTADKIYAWMREMDPHGDFEYDFNEIFGENMRVTFPMDSHDTRMLKAILRAVKQDGWLPPISDSARERQRSIYSYEKSQETGSTHNPDGGEWEPTKEEWKEWEASDAPERGFPTKKVKQKRQRLAADGGGEYEVEIDVADLGLERRVEQVIPKGPRAGEKITKVQKQGINKVIGGLENKGKLPEGAAQWWAKNQTHYTKDNNHKKLQQGLTSEDKAENMHVILSRHPIDVLRMSDISNIHSCHSEGSEYFHCAIQEAKGHGPIAYAVTEAELNKLLTPSEERERPIAKLDRMYQELGQAERITAIRQDYDTETPEGALMLLWVWARTNAGTKWWNGMEKKVEMAAKPEKFKEVMIIAQAKALNINPLLFKQYVKNYEDWESRRPGAGDFEPWKEITSEEEYKAALEKHSEEATRAPDPKDIGDFDDEEIFADRDRDISGIGVNSRVRLRKYVDDPNELTFAAPESRTYGRGTPGFVGAVREFVWEKQKDIFAQELGDIDAETGKGEATTYFIPQLDYLTRYGGSYGDTRDGEILSMFFRPGRAEGLDDPFPFGASVHHDSEGEEEDQYEQMADEYNSAIDDLNDQANNELMHTSFGAHVNDDDWGQEPSVWADGTLTLTIPLGWGDDGEGNDVHATYEIPKERGSEMRDFENRILDLPSEYPEEVYFEHTDEGALEITYNFNCEDCRTPDDADYFLDYMRELDGKYDRFYEIVRKKLVEEGYANASAWDDTNSEIEDFEERLKNFNIIGDDDDDDPSGEIWFNLGVGHHNADPEVPLDINLPKQKLYWLTKHSNFNYASISRTLMHDNRFNDVIARGIGGRKDRNVVWVGPDTNSSFARFFAEKLKKLEAAANNYSEKQIDLPFGAKYAKEKPTYEGIDFAKDTQIGLKFPESGHREAAEVPIFLKFRIVATSKDSKEELAGAFHFVEFVDEHMDMILQAAREVTQEFIIEPNLEIAAELEKEYLSGNTAMELSEKVLSKFTYDTRTDETMNHNKAIVEWWSSGNTWSDMNVYEKEVVVEKLLRGMSNGVHIQWDQQNHLPPAWERMVREWMTSAGVAGAIINKVDFKRHAKPEITDKFFGTKDERDQKRLEYELKLAKSRWKAQHGKDPSEEEVESWRQEIMNQLGMGDASPLGFDHTPQLERIARLKKALTEAKIRGKIRKIIKEAE